MIRRLFLAAALPALLAGNPPLPETGLPFIRNFRPRAYGADAQNWCLAQDARGILFVGNNSGVLEYDGVRWRLIPTAKGGVVRSLAVGGDGRVYVGSVGEFGVLRPDAAGQLAYTALSRDLKVCPDFSDVWVTAATAQGMVFQTREALFVLDGGEIREIKASTTFHTSFLAGGRFFVRQRDVGLQELKGSRLVPVAGGERFRQESVFAMVDLSGRGGPGGILVGSRNQGLFRMTDAGIVPLPTAADAFLKAKALYQGARLPDGNVALATLRGGILFLSPEGRPLGVLDRGHGLLGDNVKSLLAGQGPSLWMALDTGIAQAEWPSPFSTFDERLGLAGQAWDVARQGGRLYVATGSGAFVLGEGETSPPVASFRPVDGPRSQCTALLALEDEVLLACGEGVFSLRKGRAVPVLPSSQSAIAFLRSRRDPRRVFASFQGSLAVLRRDGTGRTGWRREGILSGLTEDIYSMEEDPDGTLWAGSGTDRVLRIRFPADWKGSDDPRVQVARFGPGEGLAGAGPVVASAGGELAVGTKRGIFRFDAAAGRFVPHPRFQGLFPEGPRWVHGICEDARGRVWLTTSDEFGANPSTGFAQPGPEGMTWNPAPFQRLGSNAVQVVRPEADGIVWFGGAGGLMRYDPAQARAGGGGTFVALVRKLIRGRDVLLFGGEVPPGHSPALPFAGGGLRFEFSAPASFPEGVQYQVRMLGYDRDWSPWSPEAQKEYTALTEGDYEFQVRARDVQGGMSLPASFRFTILPPVYRRWWAYLAYSAALVLAARTLLQARTRRLRERNAFLHARITEATWELREKEKRLEAQASDLARMNVELRQLNEQKDEFLGIAVHDLRNPLNGMILNAELLLEDPDPKETEKRVRRMLRTGEEMKGLISRFLDIAAIDSGTVRAHLEPLALGEVFQEAWFHFQEAARGKGITLERHLPEPPPAVLADRRFLKEVLENLLSNALKFSHPGTKVRLRAEDLGGRVRITVEDQGPGLTLEDRARLFERFARLSARPTAGEPSVGLGLSIVKALVQAMNGAVGVRSEPGRGAAFQVELPSA